MGDREEQTVRVRPPGAGLGTEGGGGGSSFWLPGRSLGVSLCWDLGCSF